ncbi:MAG TPA: dodecin domain-containing protein [Nitrososphaeraceae archaeon]|nr:dodecin domain-containing protein [Nitrososphaeraceae archaeon]
MTKNTIKPTEICKNIKLFVFYNALNEANKTIRGITGIEVLNKTAMVDPNTGKINKFKTSIKL